MRPAFECAQCGNSRPLLSEACPACASIEVPYAHVESWRVDLEKGAPTVDEAMEYLNRAIRVGAAAGLRALIIVHGYGSSGAGGRIGLSARERLASNHWADRVDEFICCEELTRNSPQLTHLCRHRTALAEELRRSRMLGNAGATILMLSRQGHAQSTDIDDA